MKRRDSCVLVTKVMTDVIETSFRTSDIHKSESISRNHINRIYTRNIPLNAYIAREVRLGSYRALEPPGVIIARRMMLSDSRGQPMFGERVQFLVVASARCSLGGPGRVTRRSDLQPGLRISTKYSIGGRIIPALNRCLKTMAIDVKNWMFGIRRDLWKLRPFDGVKTTLASLEKCCLTLDCSLCFASTSSEAPVCATCLAFAGRSESLFKLIHELKYARVSSPNAIATAVHLSAFWEQQMPYVSVEFVRCIGVASAKE
jgi:DNA polymerase zeta